jgi:hypothetical protein
MAIGVRLSVVITFVVAVVVTVTLVIPATIVLAFTDFAFANIAVVFMRTKIPFAIGGPGMVVVYTAAISIPETVEESLSVVTGRDPVGTKIGWPTPISVMPLVMVSDRRPVALHPHIVRPWTGRPKRDNAGRWRRTNSDSDRDLSKNGQSKE